MQKYIIILSGPSCSGKSTIANYIIETHDRIFHIKTDTLKRLLSGYSPERDIDVKNNLTIGLCEQAMQNGLSIICEPHDLKGYKELCTKYDYKLILAYLQAPYSKLVERFNQRIQSHISSGSTNHINTDILKFQNIYNDFIKYKKKYIGTTYDTDTLDITTVVDDIYKKLNYQS